MYARFGFIGELSRSELLCQSLNVGPRAVCGTFVWRNLRTVWQCLEIPFNLEHEASFSVVFMKLQLENGTEIHEVLYQGLPNVDATTTEILVDVS
jgi:hypothetical protein